MGLLNRSKSTDNNNNNKPEPKEDRGGSKHAIKEALGLRDKDQPMADPAMKWGISPDKHPPPVYSKPEEEYTPEERAKRQEQREKGINPDLKVCSVHPAYPWR